MTNNTYHITAYPFIQATDAILYSGEAFVPVQVTKALWSNGSTLTITGVWIWNWLRLNCRDDQQPFHECEGGQHLVQNYPCDRHRFHFKDKKKASEFKLALTEIKPSYYSSLFPTIRTLSGTVVKNGGNALVGMEQFRFANDFSLMTIRMYFWCCDNLRGKFWVDDGTIIFDNISDLMLYKLTFTGDQMPDLAETYAFPVMPQLEIQ